MLTYAPTDINKTLAYDAHRGTSFSPEKRADDVIQGYLNEMAEMVETFTAYATPENEADIRADLAKYKEGYIKYLHAMLAADSRTMSSMITGPSNFPAARNRKRLDTAHKRLEEFLDWTKRFRERMLKTYDPRRANHTIYSDDADAIGKLRAKIEEAEQAQAMMVAANKIVRNKKFSDDNERAEALIELGLTRTSAYAVCVPDYMGRPGFAGYQLTNNSANIRRMKERIEQLEREAQRQEERQTENVTGVTEATVLGQPCKVVENVSIQRLQLVFDGKPPAAIREKLKHSGFRWSPTEGAWQRLLNEASRRVVEGMITPAN